MSHCGSSIDRSEQRRRFVSVVEMPLCYVAVVHAGSAQGRSEAGYAGHTVGFGGKSELAEVEIWERYIVEKRADYDRFISMFWHIY